MSPLPGAFLRFGMPTDNACCFTTLRHRGRYVAMPVSVFPQKSSLSGVQGLHKNTGDHPAAPLAAHTTRPGTQPCVVLGGSALSCHLRSGEIEHFLIRKPHFFTPRFASGSSWNVRASLVTCGAKAAWEQNQITRFLRSGQFKQKWGFSRQPKFLKFLFWWQSKNWTFVFFTKQHILSIFSHFHSIQLYLICEICRSPIQMALIFEEKDHKVELYQRQMCEEPSAVLLSTFTAHKREMSLERNSRMSTRRAFISLTSLVPWSSTTLSNKIEIDAKYLDTKPT